MISRYFAHTLALLILLPVCSPSYSAEQKDKELALAAQAFDKGNFERARPYFDRAFLKAEKMPEAEQRKFLEDISEILNGSYNNTLDYDVYKYFAQHRLRLLRAQKGSSPVLIYNEVQTIAYSCSSNHRYKEALSLLKETLADLERTKAGDYAINSCLYTLARVSEDSGDLDSACAYYEKQIAYARSTVEQRNYLEALERYTSFLVTHKIQKGLGDNARALFGEIQKGGDKDRMPLGSIAEGLVDVDFGLANQYYRLTFDHLKVSAQSVMNSGYGNWACRWAKVLHDKGKTQEAIDVLKEGIAFSRTTRWPDALERDGKPMIELCQNYMKEANSCAEATQMQRQLDSDLSNRERLHLEDLDGKINNPAVEPVEKIQAIMEKADKAFCKDNCAEGIKLVEMAVDVYEANANRPESSQMYDRIYWVRRRFAKCGREAECKALLLRIVKARMIRGFADPATSTFWKSNCGGVTWAFEELTGVNAISPGEGLDKMLELAKSTGKSGNVAFVLENMKNYRRADRLSIELELEKIRAGYADKYAYFSSLLQTANTLAYYKKLDEALIKCKEAQEVAKNSGEGKSKMPFRLSGSLYQMSISFRDAGRLTDASSLALDAYRLSIKEDSDAMISMNMRCFDDLLKAYAKAGDTAASVRLLTELLTITRASLGPDNTFTRMWLMRISTYCLEHGDMAKGKVYFKELESSLFKPGMSVSKDNEEQLSVYAKTLQQHELKGEAAKIRGKVKLLEDAHCGAH